MDRAKAREYIRELFVSGFSPAEIMVLAEGGKSRWKESTIRKYCTGLEVKDTQQKKVLKYLVEFAERDGDWDELNYFNKVKKQLEDDETSIEEILSTKRNIEEYNIDLNQFSIISEGGTNWPQLMDNVILLAELIALGYSIKELRLLKEKAEKIGLKGVLEGINFAVAKEEFSILEKKYTEILDGIRSDIKESTNERLRLANENRSKRTLIRYAENLQDQYNFDLHSLQTIMSTAETWGDPVFILDSLNKYINIQKLDAEIRAKQEELNTVNMELAANNVTRETLETRVNELHRRIGAVEERHRQSRILQNIATLLDTPSEEETSPEDFNLLCLTLLTSIRDYAYTHSSSLPLYNRYVKDSLDKATTMLTNIVNGKLT